jgi:DNA invertase Pin-like site-specific DNA recombinase
VTHKENVRRSPLLMGGTAKGSTNGHSRLTEQQVVDIRAEFAAGGVTKVAIARRLGMSKTSITGIINRRSWRHVQ